MVRYNVASTVRKLVLHEVDEWLRCDGALMTDPHPELRRNATVANTMSRTIAAADLQGTTHPPPGVTKAIPWKTG